MAMAKIVLGIATSHGPLLSTPPDMWHLRAADDRKMKHPFRGGTYSFEELVAQRAGEALEFKASLDERRRRHAACQSAIATLARKWDEVKPDVAVIFGNDQMEIFTDQNIPTFLVYYGETIENAPFSEEQRKRLPPGIIIAEPSHHPDAPQVYPGLPDLGLHIINELMKNEFDIATAKHLPKRDNHTAIPHAFGFVYRKIMSDRVVPNVPVFLNTFYPPNQPATHRCLEMGKIVAQAIESWASDARVAVFASGGLSHFVVDEELDMTLIEGMRNHDEKALVNIPADRFRSGSSEMKNWIPVAGIMMNRGMKMNLVDYVPCYRSEAGTGNAMAFVYWQ
jgi:Catalytic LigB subunit of aromatic ring-opening dioxygenase